ncbi:MAG: glycine--tRNA ligase [Clostridiales Family XIII bacterium]|jgi:glycyl-tRNA synthetase|nr:glycine--tRNA ligase [Clostridiales Family XIII bacterium]
MDNQERDEAEQTGVTMDKVVALSKNRGFVYPGSEIYGGLANSWDYGPLGTELKNNVKRAWWRKFVQESPFNVGLDAAILMNSEVWVASGHAGGFADPLVDCRSCKARFRADQLIERFIADGGLDAGADSSGEERIAVDAWSNDKMEAFMREHGVKCPECGKSDFTGIRQFNLMFRTHAGVTEDSRNEIYLRPETAQGIFVNFRNVQRTSRKKIPFGIAQIGKSFRNEITPGNFIFRTREFEQMELEFFCAPGTDLDWFAYWKKYCADFLYALGMRKNSIRFRDHDAEELSHYSNATTDIEFRFPFGWGELWGIADRTDFDLRRHMEHSGQDLSYRDPETNEKYIPYCIEPSLGADRLALAFLVNAYDEETLTDERSADETRTVLHLHPALAPFKAAVLPLTKKQSGEAEELRAALSKHFMTDFDAAGNIGKRYRREDEIGTPFCVTVDFDTAEDGAVTVRDRDTMQQIRLPIGDVKRYIEERLDF